MNYSHEKKVKSYIKGYHKGKETIPEKDSVEKGLISSLKEDIQKNKFSKSIVFFGLIFIAVRIFMFYTIDSGISFTERLIYEIHLTDISTIYLGVIFSIFLIFTFLSSAFFYHDQKLEYDLVKNKEKHEETKKITPVDSLTDSFFLLLGMNLLSMIFVLTAYSIHLITQSIIASFSVLSPENIFWVIASFLLFTLSCFLFKKTGFAKFLMTLSIIAFFTNLPMLQDLVSKNLFKTFVFIVMAGMVIVFILGVTSEEYREYRD